MCCWTGKKEGVLERIFLAVVERYKPFMTERNNMQSDLLKNTEKYDHHLNEWTNFMGYIRQKMPMWILERLVGSKLCK